MRLPSPSGARWMAAAVVALLALAAAAIVLWRGSHSVSPPPVHRVARAPAKILAKPGPPKKVQPPLSAYALEQQMTPRALLRRWDPLIAAASRRFDVPQPWIRAVIVAESGGRTMSSETVPITSRAGALGIMQLMPETYADMRAAYGLGPDPQNPHDNIFAGTAFLHRLFLTYGFPVMFSAYNDGPGNLEYRLMHRELLPLETRNYVADITRALMGAGALHGAKAHFTRPDGSPVMIPVAGVVMVRASLPGEYAPGVQTVITIGRVHQGVRESPALVKALLRKHGGGI
jgi:soluble lytic murein transglycosylase-like protein